MNGYEAISGRATFIDGIRFDWFMSGDLYKYKYKYKYNYQSSHKVRYSFYYNTINDT
jgi:hypothetical protein